MLRYALGIVTAFLFLASVCCLLYIFDQGDVIELKPSVLVGLSLFPGWEDVYEAYNIGRLQLKAVEEKEQLLAEKEQALADLQQLMAEKEAEWAAEKRRYELEKTRLQQFGTNGMQTTDVEVSARLLEAMSPEAAGEAL